MGVKQKFGVTYPTAKSDLQKLASMGIVEVLDNSGMDIATYYCLPIYQVTYEGNQ